MFDRRSEVAWRNVSIQLNQAPRRDLHIRLFNPNENPGSLVLEKRYVVLWRAICDYALDLNGIPLPGLLQSERSHLGYCGEKVVLVGRWRRCRQHTRKCRKRRDKRNPANRKRAHAAVTCPNFVRRHDAFRSSSPPLPRDLTSICTMLSSLKDISSASVPLSWIIQEIFLKPMTSHMDHFWYTSSRHQQSRSGLASSSRQRLSAAPPFETSTDALALKCHNLRLGA